MRCLYKKGQTEDVIADLIVSIIIIIIAVYILSGISADQETNIGLRINEIKYQLETKLDINTYLKMPVVGSGSCYHENLTTADLIALTDATKPGPCYKLLERQTKNFEKMLIQFGDECLDVQIEYPGGKVLTPSSCVQVIGEQKEVLVPLKEGGYAKVKFLVGTIFIMGAP